MFVIFDLPFKQMLTILLYERHENLSFAQIECELVWNQYCHSTLLTENNYKAEHHNEE